MEELNQTSVKIVKSIYAVDFTGSGKIKLAYNVKNAKEYDDNTVYYITEKKTTSYDTESEQTVDILCSLDVETNRSEKLLDLQVVKEEKSLSGFAIAMLIMAFSFFFGLIGFTGGIPALGAMGMISGIISLIVGRTIKQGKNE